MANLFLYYYENKWLLKSKTIYENKWLLDIKKIDLRKAPRFSDIFRFIDGLCTINDHLEFAETLRIYIFRVTTQKEKHFNYQKIIFRPF